MQKTFEYPFDKKITPTNIIIESINFLKLTETNRLIYKNSKIVKNTIRRNHLSNRSYQLNITLYFLIKLKFSELLKNVSEL